MYVRRGPQWAPYPWLRTTSLNIMVCGGLLYASFLLEKMHNFDIYLTTIFDTTLNECMDFIIINSTFVLVWLVQPVRPSWVLMLMWFLCLLVKACTARNCYPSPLNYYNFPKSCCTSVNEVICHGIPDRRLLQDGDILNSTYQHACAHVGNASILLARFHRRSYFCLQECCFSVSPDVGYKFTRH